MEPAPQRRIAGRYQLLSPLGTGGMGTVWRARDELLGRFVAVKEVTFPPGLSADDREILHERTRREARAAARLDHPSAVTVFDVVEQDGAPYLVMEFVQARTLAEVIRADGPLAPGRTAEIGLALLGALEAAHGSGIVHRDVKPSNVLVRDDGRVVLTDFGIASSTGDPSLTSTGLLLGSPAYIAPERARGGGPGPPSDLWSLGATLFTAVEGRPPYDGGEPLLTVAAVVTGEHVPYVAAGPLVPVLDGLLRRDPASRLDVAGARALLLEVVDSGPMQFPVTQGTAAVDTAREGGRTAVLSLGDVRQGIAAAQPEALPRPRPPQAPAAAPAHRQPLRPDGPRPTVRRRRWGVPAVVGGLAATAVVVVLALTGGESDRTTANPMASPAPTSAASTPPRSTSAPEVAPSPAAPATSVPTTTAVPNPTPRPPTPAPAGTGSGAAPAGWQTDAGTAGWTVALPAGYAQTRAGEYRDAATGRVLRIETGQGRPDAVADREQAARSFARSRPTYQQIKIAAVDYRGYEAADWEFTFEGLHVLNRVFVVDGVGHSLYFQTRAGDFAAARDDFDGIAAAFKPVGR